MEEKYLKLREQLIYLGYPQTFTLECMPLIENITSDLLQTTSSLQYYMNVAKETLKERDDLHGATEPYKCDNAKLIKENNKLHLALVKCKEDFMSRCNEGKSKIETLENEIRTLKEQIKALKFQNREYQLKNICANTISSMKKTSSDSRNVIKNKTDSKMCSSCADLERRLENESKETIAFKNEISKLHDRVVYLKSQLDHRDKEIERLHYLFEGGRPLATLKKECCCNNDDEKLSEMVLFIKNLEEANENLNIQLKESIAKQHEAMSRAINLADKYEFLQKQLEETDKVALKMESECNKQLKEKCNIVKDFQEQLEILTVENDKYKKKINSIPDDSLYSTDIQQKLDGMEKLKKSLHSINEINEKLLVENKILLAENRQFENTMKRHANLSPTSSDHTQNVILGKCNNCGKIRIMNLRENNENLVKHYCMCDNISKDSLIELIGNERKFYESHINEIKSKLNFKNDMENKSDCLLCKKLKEERDFYSKEYRTLKNKMPTDDFIIELQNKICGLEQRIYCLEKENKSLSDKNVTLKLELNDLMGDKQKVLHDAEKSHRTQMLLEHLESDLAQAHDEIKKLEIEREVLREKLKATTAMNQSTFREDMLSKYRTPSADFVTSQNLRLQQDCNNLRENLKISDSELLHVKTLYNQMKSLQCESDRTNADMQERLNNSKKEINALKNNLETMEKLKNDLEYELRLLKADKLTLKENISQIDRERDKLVIDIDEKTEKVTSLQHHIRGKDTAIELLENKVTELNRKLDLLNGENATLEHKLHDAQSCSESLSLELDAVTKQKDNVSIENRRLQSDLAAVTNDLRSLKREYDSSRKEVEEMKQQLQHYVDEVRRIEDILSRKEAERTEMLDHFASLSHEATVLETNNHSLENEAASKNVQLQLANEKTENLESKLKSRESIIEMQEEKISSLLYKISTLETELAKQKDANKTTEQMLIHTREMCTMLENQKRSILTGIGDTDSEKKNLERSLDVVSLEKKRLEDSAAKNRFTIESLETSLAESRREALELKTSLRDHAEDIKNLNRKIENLQKHIDVLENESQSSRQRTEEAANLLQDLEFQMTDERRQRAQSRHRHASGRTRSGDTL